MMKRAILGHNAGIPQVGFTGRAWLRLAVWASFLMCLRAAGGADPLITLEYRVKGGYLYNFARFVEWPPGSLPLPDSPFIIGVLDGGDITPILRSLLDGKQVDAHPVQVKQVTLARAEKGLQMLFVTRAAGSSPKEVQALVGPTGTLVVGETEHFAEEGGMVGFTREEDRIRVCLNLERASAAGLKVSSKLASVARLVRTREP